MRQTTVAIPAPPVFINPGNRLGMAALAICQHHLGAMVGNVDIIGNHARVEYHRILDALKALGHQVIDQVIIGQVAVDALDPAMGPE